MDISSDIKKAAADIRRRLTAENCAKSISLLEAEWAKYKYLILGKNPVGYKALRRLLKDKSAYPVEEFYTIVDESLAMNENPGWEINAAQHVFGYFKNVASDVERADVIYLITRYKSGDTGLSELKAALYRLAVKYDVSFITDSYYFWDM